MKAQAFLILVGEMLTAQQDYFALRRHSDLIKAKDLEKRVMVIVKEGRLEPDAATTVETANEPEQIPLFGDDDEEAK